MYTIKISEAALEDISDSVKWYNEQLEDLGADFTKQVFTTLTLVETNPLHYSIRFSGKFHFAKITRFPFLIVYEIVEDIIIINAVFHTSRNPSKF